MQPAQEAIETIAFVRFSCSCVGWQAAAQAMALWLSGKRKRRSAAFHKPAWGQPEISGSGFDFFEIRAGQKHEPEAEGDYKLAS